MFIFQFLLLSSFLLSNFSILQRSRKSKFWYFPLIILFVIIVSIVGFRDNVGVDFDGYKTAYDLIPFEGAWRYEIGFRYMMKFFSDLGFGSWAMFLFSAVITWFFIFKSFEKFPQFLPWALFYILTGGWFLSSLNGIRQIIAVSIFVYAFSFIIEKKIIKYLILIGFASLFHQSAILMIPLYFFINKFSFKSPIWFYLYAILFPIIANINFANITPAILQPFNQLFSYLSMKEDSNGYDLEWMTTTYEGVYNSGTGFYLNYFISLFIIYFSQKLVRENEKYSPYFNMYYIHSFLFMFMWKIPAFNRIDMYFIFFGVFCFTFLVNKFLRSKRYKHAIFFLIFIELFYSFAIVYNLQYNFIS